MAVTTADDIRQALAIIQRIPRKPWAPIVIAAADMRPKRTRQRAPNVACYIKQARKAGDKGPVRVEITDAKGRTVTVTSEQNQAQHVDAARSIWDKKLAH
jgi:hypothetical protein